MWTMIGILCTLIWFTGCEPVYRTGRGPKRVEPPDNSIPHWVLHPPIDLTYVYGVGTDLRKDRNTAIEEGRRDIARQLHIVIRGDNFNANDIDLDVEDNGSSPVTSLDHLELPGITITKEVVTEHCLYLQVALNREAWASSLLVAITGIDQEINQVLDSHKNKPEIDPRTHPIGSAARLHQRLMPLVNTREEKARHFHIAKPGGYLPNAPITSSAMRETLASVLAAVSVDMVAAPDLDPILPQLTAACANLGLSITPGAANPLLRLKLTLNSSQSVVDGMERLEGTFRCTVETGDGRNLGGINITLRSSSLTNTVARDRLLRKIQVSWADYLDSDFVSFLTRL
jgi:hypothetical protein